MDEFNEKLNSLLESPSRYPAQDYSNWRMEMLKNVISGLVKEQFGVKTHYVPGSTQNETAGPPGEIDVLVHFGGEARRG